MALKVSADGPAERAEQERQRMIRMGKITPFQVPDRRPGIFEGSTSVAPRPDAPLQTVPVRLEEIRKQREAVLARRPRRTDSAIRLDASFIDDGDKHTFDKRIKKHRQEAPQQDHEDFVDFGGNYRLPGHIYDQLFDYQRTGVKWMHELHVQEAGGIIADEMVCITLYR